MFHTSVRVLRVPFSVPWSSSSRFSNLYTREYTCKLYIKLSIAFFFLRMPRGYARTLTQSHWPTHTICLSTLSHVSWTCSNSSEFINFSAIITIPYIYRRFPLSFYPSFPLLRQQDNAYPNALREAINTSRSLRARSFASAPKRREIEFCLFVKSQSIHVQLSHLSRFPILLCIFLYFQTLR